MYQGIEYVHRYIDVSDNPCYSSSDMENLCTLFVRTVVEHKLLSGNCYNYVKI